MKLLLLTITMVFSLSVFASDLNKCRKYQSPISYDLERGYLYNQQHITGYYQYLIDTGHKPYPGLNIDGRVRIVLTENKKALVHYIEQHYRVIKNEFGYEQREIISNHRKKEISTTWEVSEKNGQQALLIKGVGIGVPAYCSSSNPGLHFTYFRSFQPLQTQNTERYFYLGGASYDIFNPPSE